MFTVSVRVATPMHLRSEAEAASEAASQATRLRPHTPPDRAQWAYALKALMPTDTLGQRKRVELAMQTGDASLAAQKDESPSTAATIPVPEFSTDDPAMHMREKRLAAHAPPEDASPSPPHLVLPALLPELKVDEEPLWFEVVHAPAVLVRAQPAMTATILGTLRHGALLLLNGRVAIEFKIQRCDISVPL